jgi:hypothetical protein
MPHVLTRRAYHFDELSPAAKERARDWWRALENQDFDTEYVIDDAQRMGAILGIELDTKPVKLMGGGTRYDPVVYWSQGDGACFEGRYRYAKGASKAIRAEAPKDTELHRIADALQRAQRKAFYRLEARCQHRGHYCHSGCMSVDVSDADDDYRTLPDGAEDAITDALRDFANWIYRQLEQEYEWRMADDQVDDAITANEYDFDERGNRLA